MAFGSVWDTRHGLQACIRHTGVRHRTQTQDALAACTHTGASSASTWLWKPQVKFPTGPLIWIVFVLYDLFLKFLCSGSRQIHKKIITKRKLWKRRAKRMLSPTQSCDNSHVSIKKDDMSSSVQSVHVIHCLLSVLSNMPFGGMLTPDSEATPALIRNVRGQVPPSGSRDLSGVALCQQVITTTTPQPGSQRLKDVFRHKFTLFLF